MYTGLIREIGEVISHDPIEGVVVRAPKTAARLRPGASACVSGVCVTAEAVEEDGFRATLCAETLRRSTLDALAPGSRVNLEWPIAAGDALEGHLVQGHGMPWARSRAWTRTRPDGASGSARPSARSRTWSRRARSRSTA